MRRLTRDEIFGLPILAALLIYVALRFAMPVWVWFDVAALDVQNTVQDAMPLVTLDRTIHREFDGSWQAVIRQSDDAGGWVSVLSTPVNERPYLPDSRLPEPVTLEWLVDAPGMDRLPCGAYDLIVTWRVWPDSPVWERTLRRHDSFSIVCPE